MELEEIYGRQADRVYRLAMLYLKNTADAEDAVQGIFLKVLQNQPTFQNPEHEKAWFIRTTHNYCRDVLKSFWRRKVDMGEIPERGGGAEEGELLAEVMRLPAKYREAVYLYYYEGYSLKEMAGLLGVKESTMRVRLMRARERLKLEITGNQKGAAKV